MGHKRFLLIEVLGTRSASELRAAATKYQETHGTSLRDAIQGSRAFS